MRRLTDEERRWLSQFDRTYNSHRTKQKKYLSDTLRGIRVGTVEDLERDRTLADSQIGDDSSVVSIMRELSPRQKKVPYNPSDYWAMPEVWYTKNWVIPIINHIDRSRGAREDTGIPGILNVDEGFQVNSFFEQKKVSLGVYDTLEEAKKVLRKYNRTVTMRGFGVDYDE